MLMWPRGLTWPLFLDLGVGKVRRHALFFPFSLNCITIFFLSQIPLSHKLQERCEVSPGTLMLFVGKCLILSYVSQELGVTLGWAKI